MLELVAVAAELVNGIRVKGGFLSVTVERRGAGRLQFETSTSTPALPRR